MLLAHGQIVELIRLVVVVAGIIIVSSVNAAVVVPTGLLISWKCFHKRSKRARLFWGLLIALVLFVGLWGAELFALLFYMANRGTGSAP